MIRLVILPLKKVFKDTKTFISNAETFKYTTRKFFLKENKGTPTI